MASVGMRTKKYVIVIDNCCSQWQIFRKTSFSQIRTVGRIVEKTVFHIHLPPGVTAVGGNLVKSLTK